MSSATVVPDDGTATKSDETKSAPAPKPVAKKKKRKKKRRGKAFKLDAKPPLCTYFNPFMWILILVDILLICITGTWTSLFKRSTPKITVTQDGAVRQEECKDGLKKTAFGCKTAYEVCRRSFLRYRYKPAMGTRKFLGWHHPEGARFPLKMFGATSWITYAELGERAHAFGSGLIEMGMKPLPRDEGKAGGTEFEKTTDPHTLLIYEETCADWMTALMGAFTQSLVAATSYATLGIEAIVNATNECNVKVILCNRKDVQKLLKAASKMPSLTHIVYTNNYVTPEEVASPLKVENAGSITVMSFDEVCEVGRKAKNLPTPPTPDNMAVIMYTSGSTGKPKGVMIRQRNIVASASMMHNWGEGILEEGNEVYIAYLPAAHIFELIVEFCMLGFGARVGYSDPRSFSSAGAVRKDEKTGKLHMGAKMKFHEKDEKNMAPGGLQSFRPTFVVAVPKIWDILKKGVESGVGGRNWFLRNFIQFGYAWRNWLLHNNTDSVIFYGFFKSAFSPILGDRQKVFATGGGPIASEVQSFIRTLFVCPLIQGYALTETCCAGSVQDVRDSRDGVVGPPASSIEIRLRSCVEPKKDAQGNIVKPEQMIPSVLDRAGKPYLNSDASHYGMKCMARGEVLIRGESVSSGYLKKPKKTAEEFDKDGWFHTGDIAIMLPDGCIRIVDRLKNLVKLKGGEYIAIESMEKEYSKSAFVNGVNGGIMCYGDGDMDRPVAFVQVDVGPIKTWARSKGVPVDDVEKMLRDDRVCKMVLDDLNKEGARGGVGRNEKLVAVALISGNGSKDELEFNSPWTPENGGLTASNKLQRRSIWAGLEDVGKPLKQKGIR